MAGGVSDVKPHLLLVYTYIPQIQPAQWEQWCFIDLLFFILAKLNSVPCRAACDHGEFSVWTAQASGHQEHVATETWNGAGNTEEVKFSSYQSQLI